MPNQNEVSAIAIGHGRKMPLDVRIIAYFVFVGSIILFLVAGLLLSGLGQVDNTTHVGNPYMFTGRRFDPETRLYYYRARYY